MTSADNTDNLIRGRVDPFTRAMHSHHSSSLLREDDRDQDLPKGIGRNHAIVIMKKTVLLMRLRRERIYYLIMGKKEKDNISYDLSLTSS